MTSATAQLSQTLLWLTDPHLDHLRGTGPVEQFARALRAQYPHASGLLVSGDIAEAGTCLPLLSELTGAFGGPAFFVLGNHDFYGSSFAEIDAAMDARFGSDGSLCLSEVARLVSVEHCPTGVTIAAHTLLVGSAGWYDARYGDEGSELRLTDFVAIQELFAAQDEGRQCLLSQLRSRADKAASRLKVQCESALVAGNYTQVLCLTHVPPFQESAFYQGQSADGRWAPFFSSAATGQVLLELADKYPEVKWTVLCGHTHGCGTFQARDNLVVLTGRATYGKPLLAGLVEIGSECCVQLCAEQSPALA